METRHLYRIEREMITSLNIQIDNQQRLLVCIVCVLYVREYGLSDMTVQMAEEICYIVEED
jgi:hypothetical protein